jgi:hypothetical protein
VMVDDDVGLCWMGLGLVGSWGGELTASFTAMGAA